MGWSLTWLYDFQCDDKFEGLDFNLWKFDDQSNQALKKD